MMSKELIGKIIEHEGKIYQVLSVKNALATAHSYGNDCGIAETILISIEKGRVVAQKAIHSKERGNS
mgnify:FL=1